MSTRRLLGAFGGFIMLAAIGIGIWYFGLEYPRQMGLEGSAGRMTQGVIVQVGTEESGRYKGYYSDIRFADDKGKSHQIRALYTMQYWGNLQVGQTASIRYLAADPDYAIYPMSYKARRAPRVIGLITFGLLAFGMTLAVLPRIVR